MTTLVKNIGCLVTVNSEGRGRLRSADMGNCGMIPAAAMIFDETILWVGSDVAAADIAESGGWGDCHIVDAGGMTVLPGFVDSHTHLVYAGSRAAEYARRLQGVTYQQVAREGGGIISTMHAVRNATVDELTSVGEYHAIRALEHGTTTLEVKSGYGLDLRSELNMLNAIHYLQDRSPQRLMATFMGAHDVPPEFAGQRSAYVDFIIEQMLPAVADQGIARFCDVFVDEGYFTLQEGRRILATASALGLLPRLHADELACLGAAGMAVEAGALSADHLLHISDRDIAAISSGTTVATLLPGTAYTLGLPYAPARRLIDAGATVALASDCNPGSCLTENMQLILSLACTNMGMTIEEAIVAATINGAAALGADTEIGSLEAGKQADFVIYEVEHYHHLVYHFGVNHVQSVWIGGQPVL